MVVLIDIAPRVETVDMQGTSVLVHGVSAEGPSGSAIRSLIPSHRELLRSKAVVVSVAETSGQ